MSNVQMRDVKQSTRYAAIALSIPLAGTIFALLDPGGFSAAAWLAYTVISALSAGLLLLGWRWLAVHQAPRWLGAALGISLLLRLALGFAFAHALPVVGYDTPTQRGGYSYQDAHARDEDAWALAESGDSLLQAFSGDTASDQYGGLLFLSSAVYRVLSPDLHRPLLIMVLAAVFSTLAVLVIWAFAAQVTGARAAKWAAWIAVLYPDAVLLGSSQMREAFVITAIALLFYGYAVLRRGRTLEGILTIVLTTVILALPMSPPYALAGLLVVGGAWLWEGRLKLGRSRGLALVMVLVGALAVFLVVQAWSRIGDLAGSGIEVLLAWWRSAGSQWSQDSLWSQSDWTRRLLESIPSQAYIPFFVTYGLIRPFLPGGLIDSGAPIWRAVAIWRGLGWFALLPFLIYAPFAALRRRGWRSLETYLALVVWVTALLASYRGTGDQWDNPRYRAIFLLPQAVLAGWAWVDAQRSGSPWLARLSFAMLIATGLFTTWYAMRYTWRPTVTVIQAILVIAAALVIFLLGALAYDLIRSRRVRT